MSDFVEGQIGSPEVYEEPKTTRVKEPREEPRERRRSNVGPYKLEDRIDGGKAECWMCTDTRDGSKRFLKKFPSPKMPSEEERAFDRVAYDIQVAHCDAFLVHHQSIARDLTNERIGNGSLVQPTDAFWHDSSFFKIYPFIADLSPLNAKIVSDWDPKRRVLAIRGMLLALRELHANEIVHADIKIENIHLIKVASGSVARLIDFDDSYRARTPPPPRDLGGTEDFYSPEVYVYKGFLPPPKGFATSPFPLVLGTHSDLFSLSLAIHETFSLEGRKPRWSSAEKEACENALAGGEVEYESIGTGKPLLEYRLGRCLQLNPTERPRISELLSACGTNLGRAI